jgi:crotonobetainyl-CoA:carnitine CoA-transferase CaiB-like acyl-CoA transferase
MDLPLKGVRVIDAAQFAAAPSGAAILADYGAEVIHVEHPVKGDGTRGVQSKGGTGIFSQKASFNYVWELVNRNKKGITIDLAMEKGQKVMYKLVEKADVFLSNLRPYEVEKFGLSYEALSQRNSKLIYANLNGYGQYGRERNGAGYDSCAFFARSGILHQLAEPGTAPVMSRPGMGDHITGLTLFAGIMLALFIRERTGIGQEVDVSLFNSGVFMISLDVQAALIAGEAVVQERRKEAANPLRNHYETKDGKWLMLAMLQPDPYWSEVCKAIGREDLERDPRFASFQMKGKNNIELIKILDEVFATRTMAEWKEVLEKCSFPWAPIQSVNEIVVDPQARANDFFAKFDHPTYGPIELVRNPIKLSKTPATIRSLAPEFSQHTEEVLLEHGYTWEDIAELKEKRVIA